MKLVRPNERSDSISKTSKVSATDSFNIPQSWLGRLMYILFNARTGR